MKFSKFLPIPAMAALMLSTVHAQLFVSVAPPNTSGQKIVVPLTMKNALPQTIQSARAVVFVVGDGGEVLGQGTHWVIGGAQDKAGLPVGATNSFNFVVATHKSLTTTNVTTKVSFNRVVLEGGKLADINKDVEIRRERK